MQLPDPPQAVLFVLFLLVFLLVGIYPAWQRTAARIRKLLDQAKSSVTTEDGSSASDRRTSLADPQTNAQLDDFEVIILRRLAQNGNKALSRKQLNADLHLEPAIVTKSLESLLRRELVGITMTALLGIRFYLSETGRAYAIEQGYILSIHGLNNQT